MRNNQGVVLQKVNFKYKTIAHQVEQTESGHLIVKAASGSQTVKRGRRVGYCV